MSETSPPFPAPIVRLELEKLKMSQAEIAEALGVERLSVNMLVNGKRSITPTMALKLESLTGISCKHWMKLQTDWDLWMAKGRVG